MARSCVEIQNRSLVVNLPEEGAVTASLTGKEQVMSTSRCSHRVIGLF